MTPERIKRINYTLDLGRINKTAAVKEFGIGEDLVITLLGWVGEDLKMVCVLAPNLPKERRFESLFMSVVAMRRGYGIDSVTVLNDGYFTEVEAEDHIVQRFADGDRSVTEAILVTSVEADNDEATLHALAYHQGLGRKVSYSNVFARSLDAETAYAAGFKRALQAEMGEPVSEEDLRANGISVEVMQ